MLLLEEDLLRIDESALASLGLSRREREVLALVAEGMTNAEIAALIWVSPRTVKKHLEGVYEKLGVHTRTAAAAIALRTSRGVLS
jgi:DNA-binding CsgD family transcriptional regulator